MNRRINSRLSSTSEYGVILTKSSCFPNAVNRVANLFLLLEDIAQNTSERQLDDKTTADLLELIKGISGVLEEITVVLEKYESLGKHPSTIGSKAEKAWRSLRWDQNAINDFRFRIISSTAVLDAFNSNLTGLASQTMIESLEKLDGRVGNLQLDTDHEKRRRLLDWLTPLDFSVQQSVFFGRRQKCTGHWLLQSVEFNTWMSTLGKSFLCRGMPGAGKTIMASTIIDHLLATFCNDQIPVVYIYCDYTKQYEQTPDSLIASILKQLLQNQSRLSGHIWKTFDHQTNSGTRPSADEIYALLQSTLSEFSQVYIVVDAVDELSDSGQVRRTLLSKLNALQEIDIVNLMVTSRFIPQIKQELHDPRRLEIRASDDDVRRYAERHINKLAKCVLKNPQLQESVVNSIVNVVDGIFLLAKLHMDSLRDKRNPKSVRKFLESLPKGSHALNSAYNQAMQRIEGQKPGFRDLARRTLSWVTMAYAPLTVAGMRHALAI